MKLYVLTLMTLLLAACGGPDVVPDRTDSDGLIRYAIPDGWENTSISSGDHYKREGIENSPILAIVARQRTSAPTNQQVQEGTRGKHELQGHALLDESTRMQNGFTVWEAVYEANLRGQEAILHDVYLFSDALQVEINLNASRQDHEKFIPDLQVVVASLQAITAE